MPANLLVILAAPARSPTLKNALLDSQIAPKVQTKPESEESTPRPPSKGGPLETIRDNSPLDCLSRLTEAQSSTTLGKIA